MSVVPRVYGLPACAQPSACFSGFRRPGEADGLGFHLELARGQTSQNESPLGNGLRFEVGGQALPSDRFPGPGGSSRA